MKITLGIDGGDSPETVKSYAEGGADEFFASYVPEQWSNTYGWEVCPNRRPFSPGFHYVSLTCLQEVIEAAREKNARVSVTLNAHQYCAELLPLLQTMVSDLERIAPDAYMVASPALLTALREWGVVDRPIHLSTGTGCYNSDAIRYLTGLAENVERVVLPRKMSLREMRTLVNAMADTAVAFEAMVLGSRCRFNDAYCFTRHSPGDGSFCGVFVDADTSTLPHYPQDWKAILTEIKEAAANQLQDESTLEQFIKTHLSQERRGKRSLRCALSEDTNPGLSSTVAEKLYGNCGLCAIPLLRDIGIEVLKLPSRGVDGRNKRRYIHLVRTMLDTPGADETTAQELINSPLFCEKPQACYYNHGEA